MATKTEKIIIELDFDTSKETKNAAVLNTAISKLTKTQKELKKNNQEGSIAFQKNSEALRANKKELAETNKTITNLTKANKSNAGSNDQLKAQLSILTARYNKLSAAERKGTDSGKQLKKQISQTTKELKGNEEAVGDSRRSVGDYGKALGGTPFGSFIGGIKGMGAAFLANPIGLIITAIVLALAALKKSFEASEEGENKMAKATAILGTILDRLVDIIGPLANLIGDQLATAFDFLGEQMEEAAVIAENLLTFLNFDDAAESLKNYTAETKRAVQGTKEVADSRAKADLIEREVLVERAKVEGKIAELRLKAKKEDSVSAAERKKALLEARDLEDGLLVKEQEVLKLRFEAQKNENTFAKSNKENLNKAAQLEAELFRNQSERANAQRTIQRELNTVNAQVRTENSKRASEAKKQVANSIKQNKDALRLFIASQGTRAKSLEEQVKIAEQVLKEETDILQQQLDARLISQTQFEIASISITKQFLDIQTKLVLDNAERELDIILENNASEIEANKFLSDELFTQEQERLNNKLEAELAFQATRLEQGIISEQEFNEAVNAVNAENEEANKVLKEEKAQADAEAKIVDLANQREIDLLNREDEFQLKQEDLDRRKEQELKNAESTGVDTQLINAKFAALDKKLDQEKAANKLAIASTTFGNLAEIAGKESAAGKAFAIAQTTIDTFVGAQAAFNSLASIPIVGTVLGAIAAAAAVAGGIARVNKIKSTQAPKAARGTIIGGQAHSAGGTKGYFDDGTEIEVEKGELLAVVNKRNTGLLNSLNDLNTFEGYGDSFFNKGGTKTFLQDGGIGLNNVSQDVQTENQSTQAVIDTVSNLPRPIVIVEEINQAQSSGIEVANRAKI